MRRAGAPASPSAYDNAHSSVSNHQILYLVFGAIGTFFVLRALWNVASALDSRKWPHVPGVMGPSEVVVAYHFRIEGEEHTGSRLFFGDASRTALPLLLGGRPAPNSKVTVHYNPAKPRDCVLRPGLNPFVILDLIFGLVFLAVALAFFG